MPDEPVITYTLEQVFEGINQKLTVLSERHDQESRRMDKLENRVGKLEQVVMDELPRIRKFMEDQDVQQQVEAALDSRRVKGLSQRDRVIVGGLSACILAVTILSLIHGLFAR